MMATILDGETDSDTVDLTGKKLKAIVPSSFTGAYTYIIYQVAPGVWLPVQDSWGRQRSFKITNGWVTALDSDQQELSKGQSFRLRSDVEQDGDCTLTLVTEDV
jgi:hypothetical protein